MVGHPLDGFVDAVGLCAHETVTQLVGRRIRGSLGIVDTLHLIPQVPHVEGVHYSLYRGPVVSQTVLGVSNVHQNAVNDVHGLG